ncbi:hypothetical protein, partial [Camelimonas fluminis]|uniref:hypothetical protein n=1 Tax=Camelimonas fluminis TaxID=1576911 RepID=UPI001AEE31E0
YKQNSWRSKNDLSRHRRGAHVGVFIVGKKERQRAGGGGFFQRQMARVDTVDYSDFSANCGRVWVGVFVSGWWFSRRRVW